jgi:hypothetical protein
MSNKKFGAITHPVSRPDAHVPCTGALARIASVAEVGQALAAMESSEPEEDCSDFQFRLVAISC